MVNIYYITYYGLKDEMLIFQFPFMAESRQTLCAKRFSNLSQTIFRCALTACPIIIPSAIISTAYRRGTEKTVSTHWHSACRTVRCGYADSAGGW